MGRNVVGRFEILILLSYEIAASLEEDGGVECTIVREKEDRTWLWIETGVNPYRQPLMYPKGSKRGRRKSLRRI